MPHFNLFSQLPNLSRGEEFRDLLKKQHIKIERIVSAHKTQSAKTTHRQDKWMLLLRGNASLDLDGTKMQLTEGDSFFIPAGTQHQILDTVGDPDCVWLAVQTRPEQLSNCL